ASDRRAAPNTCGTSHPSYDRFVQRKWSHRCWGAVWAPNRDRSNSDIGTDPEVQEGRYMVVGSQDATRAPLARSIVLCKSCPLVNLSPEKPQRSDILAASGHHGSASNPRADHKPTFQFHQR